MDYSEHTRDGLKVLWSEAVKLSFKAFCKIVIVRGWFFFFDLQTSSAYTICLLLGQKYPYEQIQKTDLHEL